jgi:ATP-dependent helicase/nuclease subunit A
VSRDPRASVKQLEASDPSATAWVNANAGSGKTHVLVDRVIRLMLGGTEPSRIMCLTFTKAAAAEMANRLFERLGKWVALTDADLATRLDGLGIRKPDRALLERARQLFTRALETPGGLKIQTIHAFCERVLQLFPVEAGVVPHFTILDDRQSAEMLELARNRVLAVARAEPDSPLGLALDDVANRVSADDFDGLLTQLLAKRASLRDVLEGAEGLRLAEMLLRHHLNLDQGLTPETIRASLTIDTERHLALAAALESGSAAERERGARLRSLCRTPGTTLGDLEQILLTKSGEPRKGVANKPTLARHPGLGEFIEQEQGRLAAALGQLGDFTCMTATLSLLRLGADIVAAFEGMKRRRGAYDFEDLIIRTGELLSRKPDAAWVLYKLDGGIDHLLVDEAQDTSPMQWQIIRLLTDEFFAGEGRHGAKPRTLFVVGDRKQSIYSFQGADPNVFEQVRTEVEAQVKAADQIFRSVDFTVSFRSAPPVLTAVDAVFEPGSQHRRGLDGGTPRDWIHVSTRRNDPGTVEIWPLAEADEEEKPEAWQAPVDREPARSPRRRLAKTLAQTIRGWIGRRWLASAGRTVEPGDILILVRKRSSFFDAMIRALWNEQVPVAGADRLTLGDNIAVLDLMALAQFALMPEDDHALACVLKSPILPHPLNEEELMRLATSRGGLSLWSHLQQQSDGACADAAARLGPLVAAAPAARPFEFLSHTLTWARPRFVSRLGSEANDAIDALLDRALDYEEQNGTSLAGFVNWLAAGDIEIKRNMEQGPNEVRVMTVHGAKGLEAPIVILPDTTGAPHENRAPPLLLLEGDAAASRVPLWPVPNLRHMSRVQHLKDACKTVDLAEDRRLLYVAMTRARDELYVTGFATRSARNPNCWYDTISEALKPLMAELPDGQGWRMGAAPEYRFKKAPAAAATHPVPDWLWRRLDPAEAAPASDTARRSSTAAAARGTLIHGVLERLPDVAEAERDAFIAARAGGDAKLAADLRRLAGHPVMAALLAADGLSEAPLIVTGADGRPERRRIDRLVITETGVLVADYKTDRTVPDTPEACNPDYLRQMAQYRDALRKIHPGAALRLCLVWTQGPRLMELPETLLDRISGLRPGRP